MQYNIINGALWEVNTISGNVALDFTEVYRLSDYDDDLAVELADGDVFVMDFDFGHRMHLSHFEYKFTTSHADSTAVASGVKFYYKNEGFESYTNLETYVSASGIFYTTISGGTFAPRHIRSSHTLDNTYGVTTITGSAYGFRALNNENIVDFGEDGTNTEESIITARGSSPVIKTVAIYNSGDVLANALVNIEPTYSLIDDVVSISNSEDGPWVFPLGNDGFITNSDNFLSGGATNTHLSATVIRITGIDEKDNHYASIYAYGYYDTRIFQSNLNAYCRFIINKEGNRGGQIKVNKDDSVETIQIRSSNAPPKPYGVFRELRYWTISTTRYLGYRDRWLEGASIKEDSTWSFLTCGQYTYWRDYRVVFDQLTERWAGYATHYGSDSRGTAELRIYNNVGTSSTKNYRLSYQSTGGTAMNFSWRETKLDVTGGMWIYFFCKGYHSGDFVNTTGYYLAYFDHNLSNTFKWYTKTEEIGVMDINYDSKEVWYTRPSTAAIYKVATNGTVLINYIDEDYTSDIGGIAVMPNGFLMFADGKNLHQLKYNGLYLPEYYMEDVAEDKISYIALDGDGSEAIWVIDGMTVGRLYMSGGNKGNYDFRVEVDYPVRMVSVEGGVWVHCASTESQGSVVMRYISKATKRVDEEYNPNYNSSPGILYQTYTNDNYSENLPIATDTVWSTLPWKTIAHEGFLSSEDRYHQIRMYLRREEPIERYPDHITDPEQDYIKEDDFVQTEDRPKDVLWGSWRDNTVDDGLNRVHVDTVNNNLVLVNDPGGPSNAYIDTRNRVIYQRNSHLEWRVSYKFGAGNSVDNSGKNEYLYVYAHSVQQGFSGEGLYCYLKIPINPGTYSPLMYVKSSKDGSWTLHSYYHNKNMYEGTLRLYWQSDNDLYAQFAPPGTTSFTGPQAPDVSSSQIGNYFYLQIQADRNSSPLVIKDVTLQQGRPYYYTDSPRVTSIHKQELVEVKEIYPNNHKDMYVRTFVPQNLEVESYYDIDMKVRWRTPVY